ncbi:MAG: LPS assembly protein LptD [Deltaproteobacteria bacterium]
MLRQLFLVLFFLLPVSAIAQAAETASLVADRILFGRTTELVAEGHVEVFWKGIRVTATRIRFDPTIDKLTIEGPIVLTDGTGNTIYATQAKIDTKLQDGIMQSARMIIQDRLRLDADELSREGQRYTRLSNVRASACDICATNPKPLWEIRAKKVVHDQVDKEIRFTNAQLRVLDFPIFYLPRLKIPDPSVERASGFLVPKIRTTTSLGLGFKLPYFVTFGNHTDFTLTPYLSAETRTLELQVRRALSYGTFQIDAAASNDTILSGETRAYLFGKGAFLMRGDYVMTVDLKLASDPGYLLDYGYSELDRLVNEIALTKTKRDLQFTASIRNIRTLRDSELPIKDTLPSSLINVAWDRRFRPGFLPGHIDLDLALDGFERRSTADMIGRDVLRAKADVSWGNSYVFSNGMVGEALLGGKALGYLIGQDSTYAQQSLLVVPYASASLRWPLTRKSNGGHSLLEPVVQVSWSDKLGADVPNEDSVLAEFDEGNLLAISRFPGDDANSTGFRIATGVNWSQDYAGGWTLAASAGRLFRVDLPSDFTDASGLQSKHSDWLFWARAGHDDGLAVSSRLLFDPNFAVTKASAAVDWNTTKLDLATQYDWVIADAGENRPDPLSEISFDSDWRITDSWTTSATMRFDPRDTDVRNASLGVKYQNECVTVDLSISRRFTASTSVDPTTDVNLRVALGGFGEKAGPTRRVCGR